jgi:hypothetical protein
MLSWRGWRWGRTPTRRLSTRAKSGSGSTCQVRRLGTLAEVRSSLSCRSTNRDHSPAGLAAVVPGLRQGPSRGLRAKPRPGRDSHLLQGTDLRLQQTLVHGFRSPRGHPDVSPPDNLVQSSNYYLQNRLLLGRRADILGAHHRAHGRLARQVLGRR